MSDWRAPDVVSGPVPELVIGRLDLQLPAGFGPRADNIARDVAKILARLPLPESAWRRARSDGAALDIDRLAVPALTISAGLGDAVIAERIAAAVRDSLGRHFENSAISAQPGRRAPSAHSAAGDKSRGGMP